MARCAEPGCQRVSSSGSALCALHRVRAVAMPVTPANGSVFGVLPNDGQLDPVLVGLLQKAGTDAGLNGEIGALRLVLHRLLTDHELPVADLARHVARVTAVIAQVCRAQRAISGEMADGITDALTQLLVELDGGVG